MLRYVLKPASRRSWAWHSTRCKKSSARCWYTHTHNFLLLLSRAGLTTRSVGFALMLINSSFNPTTTTRIVYVTQQPTSSHSRVSGRRVKKSIKFTIDKSVFHIHFVHSELSRSFVEFSEFSCFFHSLRATLQSSEIEYTTAAVDGVQFQHRHGLAGFGEQRHFSI